MTHFGTYPVKTESESPYLTKEKMEVLKSWAPKMWWQNADIVSILQQKEWEECCLHPTMSSVIQGDAWTSDCI